MIVRDRDPSFFIISSYSKSVLNSATQSQFSSSKHIYNCLIFFTICGVQPPNSVQSNYSVLLAKETQTIEYHRTGEKEQGLGGNN